VEHVKLRCKILPQVNEKFNYYYPLFQGTC
jgi:hypothetical protein